MTEQSPAQAHAAAVRRHISALPRWGYGDRQRVIAMVTEAGAIFAAAEVVRRARYPLGQSYASHAFAPTVGMPEACHYCGLASKDPNHSKHRDAAELAEQLDTKLTEEQRRNSEQAITIRKRTDERDQAAKERDTARRELEQAHDAYRKVIGERAAAEDEAGRLKLYLDSAEHAIEELRQQFPACPACGCRAPDDPDRTECGCDEGCNDGGLPPGVQVLTNQRDRLAEEKSEGDRALMAVIAERDRLRETLAAMTRPRDSHLTVSAEPAAATAAPQPRRGRRAGSGKGPAAKAATEAHSAAQGGTEESGFVA